MIYVHDVLKQIFSRDSSCIVDVDIWPKFGTYSIYMREVIITSILERFDQENHLFWEILHQCGVRVITKSQKRNLEGNSYVCRSYRRKTGGTAFLLPPPSRIGLILKTESGFLNKKKVYIKIY